MRTPIIACLTVAVILIAIVGSQKFNKAERLRQEAESSDLASGRHAEAKLPDLIGELTEFGAVKLQPYIPAAFSSTKLCDIDTVEVVDGRTHLALLVGVGEYRSRMVNDLSGPPRDVEKMYRLLTDVNGYGFPEKNICVLLNKSATRANFIESFRKALVDRAVDGAQITIFFAGHGSQQNDLNEDETDRLDETWLFHDSGTRDASGQFSQPLVDDEFNVLMTELKNAADDLKITVILDACHSGTATRGAYSDIAVRAGPSSETLFNYTPKPLLRSLADDDDDDWFTRGDDGNSYVVLAAAGDGTVALETVDPGAGDGARSGVFTDSLFTVMSRAAALPVNYADIEAEVRRRVKSRSYQVPRFYGDLTTEIFGVVNQRRPLSWRIIRSRGDTATLGIGPLPGAGEKAVFRIYDRATPAASFGDPEFSKAQAEVFRSNGVTAEARIFARRGDAEIQEGDYAVLVNVGSAFRRTSFRLRGPNEPNGLTLENIDIINAAYSQDKSARLIFDLSDDFAPFELVQNAFGDMQIIDTQGRVRNTFTNPGKKSAAILSVMRGHARQAAIRQLAGEGGAIRDQASLRVSIVPRPDLRAQNSNYLCRDDYTVPNWAPNAANEAQTIPLCGAYEVWVERIDDLPHKIQVGGLHLSGDGKMLALPDPNIYRGEPLYLSRDNRRALIGRYQALPPLDVEETFMVFGTHEDTPMQWERYSTTRGAQMRGDGGAPSNPLVRAFDEYVELQTRSQSISGGQAEDKAYTLTSIPLRIVANADCESWGGVGCQEAEIDEGARAGTREYTIAGFDIRPYLPDQESSALARVLRQADCLSRYSVEVGSCPVDFKTSLSDGVSYNQHNWSAASDKQNLETGIDCSRSIWFSFTRAGLPYNRSDRYLPTADMVTSSSWMQDEFESCTGDYRTGDVIVYRDEDRGVGHVIMVIDRDKRIAWGSHGWDGNIRFSEESDTGVEYQLIRFKKDWNAWDRKSMGQKACWRHKQFSEEFESGAAARGQRALATICRDPENCGVQ